MNVAKTTNFSSGHCVKGHFPRWTTKLYIYVALPKSGEYNASHPFPSHIQLQAN